MGSTPIGGTVKAGKGALSFLKGLLGKAKSKTKFPVGYGEPTKLASPSIGGKQPPTSTYKLIDEMEHVGIDHPERATEITQELLKRLGSQKKVESAIENYYKLTDLAKLIDNAKPKGMRQFGKFNRQKWEKYENGGKVKKGGFLSKFKLGKKDKVPEKHEALIALEAILSGGYDPKEGRSDYPVGRTVWSDEIYPERSNIVRTIAKFTTPEGERYYPGEGRSRSNSLANELAMIDAASRAFHSPADSITTDQLEILKKLGLF